MFLPNDRSVLMYPAANGVLGLSLSSRTERGYIIAALGPRTRHRGGDQQPTDQLT